MEVHHVAKLLTEHKHPAASPRISFPASLISCIDQEMGTTPSDYVQQARNQDAVYPYLAIPDGQFAHLTQRSIFLSEKNPDWDWIAGRKGWDFA